MNANQSKSKQEGEEKENTSSTCGHSGGSREGWTQKGAPTYAARSSVAESSPTLCDPVNGCPPGSPVHGVSQVRTLEWAAVCFSRGSSPPRGQTCVSSTGRRVWSDSWGEPAVNTGSPAQGSVMAEGAGWGWRGSSRGYRQLWPTHGDARQKPPQCCEAGPSNQGGGTQLTVLLQSERWDLAYSSPPIRKVGPSSQASSN